MIHVDLNHTNSNKLNPSDSTNIRSIHDSDNIHAIEKILASPVHSPVQALPIFTDGSASDPASPPHDSSAESVTPKGNPNPNDNGPNIVPNVPADLDSDPSLSNSSSSDSSNLSEEDYYERRQCAEKDKNKCWSKTFFDYPIKN